MAEGGVSESVTESMSTDDADKVESVQMLNELAAGYADYMQTNCSKEVLCFASQNAVLLVT